MIWEVSRGRSCDSVRIAQANEIEKQGAELLAQGKAIKLTEGNISALEELLKNAREYSVILGQQFVLDKDELKKKIKKRNKLIIGEGLVILLLIVLI